MSQIPSYPIQPAGGPHSRPYNAPAENGMAIAGFVLSIVGLLSCCLTSPIGLILSIIGMKKTDQQGLAIAGLVLGILGTLGLIAIVAYIVIVMVFLGGVAFWATEAIGTASERARTNQAMDVARSTIESNVSRTRSLPSDSSGTSMVVRHRDAWNRSLRYERLGNNRYQIISSGPDKQFDTRDDIKKTFSSSNATSHKSHQSRETFAARGLKQALAAL